MTTSSSSKPRPSTASDQLSQQHRDLLDRLQTSLETGLTHDQVRSRRLLTTSSGNVVDPPIKCPAWVCCLLPCIKHVPSMKAYRAIVPMDAEIKRSNKWVRYEASSLLVGDMIRIEAGDIVPADCVVLLVDPHEPLVVDLKCATGETKPRTITNPSSSSMITLYWGGMVVQGTATCVVTAIGCDTKVSQLIQRKQFPPPPAAPGVVAAGSTDFIDDPEESGGGRPMLGNNGDDDDDGHSSASSGTNHHSIPAEQGISLLSRRVA